MARNGGRVIKTLGDGLMAVFRDPERAVESAASLQESLERSAVVPGGLPGKETAIKLKTAVAWGEIVELDNDCFGDAVNVAARILDLAGDNETLITGPCTASCHPICNRAFAASTNCTSAAAKSRSPYCVWKPALWRHGHHHAHRALWRGNA